MGVVVSSVTVYLSLTCEFLIFFFSLSLSHCVSVLRCDCGPLGEHVVLIYICVWRRRALKVALFACV